MPRGASRRCGCDLCLMPGLAKSVLHFHVLAAQ
jgi:hypothetical protein